jgi:hypothetical protein
LWFVLWQALGQHKPAELTAMQPGDPGGVWPTSTPTSPGTWAAAQPLTAEAAAVVNMIAMDAFTALGEYNPPGASASGSACVPAVVLHKGTIVKVSAVKNHKILVTAKIAGKERQVLELQPADPWDGVCRANAVAVRLEVSLRDGERRTAAMVRQMAKDFLAAIEE